MSMNESLQITIEEDKTNWRAFPLVFAVVLFLLLFLGGLLSLINVDRFFPSFRLLNMMLFLSFAVSLGLSFANRLKTMIISHRGRTRAELRDLTVSVIESAGFTCHHENRKCTFRSKQQIFRWFSDWMGTEQIILSPKGEGLEVSGPGRYLNNLTWQLESQLENSSPNKKEVEK